MNQFLRQQARQTLDRLRGELLAERTADGHWVGELAASALSTATAVSAMSAVILSGGDDQQQLAALVRKGISYLRDQQNNDGGFGDTDRSHSNIATSYLVLAASTLANQAVDASLEDDQQELLQSYIQSRGGRDALRRRYGKDKTFVVPILTNLAIAGLVDWDEVAALPFEAAVFPQSMYRLLRMPVVSYAIPALVAIGQARHFHGKSAFPPLRWIRTASIGRTMKVLSRMQPESGGYLEATPLTSFVVMSLAATGRCSHQVTVNGLKFLCQSMRDDGSWPIDTNLATWLTSLAVHSLTSDPQDDGNWFSGRLLQWHLGCQHRQRHPFTGAEPGGWGWSDLSGAVPDSDDTPAAILALSRMRRYAGEQDRVSIDAAVKVGIQWLLKLQNRDGGWPTFCRGWGRLPFDRSSTDLTAHAIRALRVGHDGRDGPALSSEPIVDQPRVQTAIRRGHRFLSRQQRDEGSWLPLWFGNQDVADESNPIYGTARVLVDRSLDREDQQRAVSFLIANQNRDGGWGGGESVRHVMQRRSLPCGDDLLSSVEETALVVEALSTVLLIWRELQLAAGVETPVHHHERRLPYESCDCVSGGGKEALLAAIIPGVEFLVQSVANGRHRVPWPIGFYFAKLWYHERLYPLVFTIAALGKYLRATADNYDPDWPR